MQPEAAEPRALAPAGPVLNFKAQAHEGQNCPCSRIVGLYGRFGFIGFRVEGLGFGVHDLL